MSRSSNQKWKFESEQKENLKVFDFHINSTASTSSPNISHKAPSAITFNMPYYLLDRNARIVVFDSDSMNMNSQ